MYTRRLTEQVSEDDVISDEGAAAESATDVISDVIIGDTATTSTTDDVTVWHEATTQRAAVSSHTATERHHQAQSR